MTVEQFAHDIAKHISGAVEVSGNAVPAVGVKTHYFVVKNILNYATPVFSGAVDGVLDTGTGEVRGFLQDGKSILPMAILTE